MVVHRKGDNVAEEIYFVYCHTNKSNNKKYFGITKQKPKDRWDSGHGYRGNRYFWSAIKKYGWDNFEHIILKDSLSLEEANYWEEYYIKQYNSTDNNFGYNLSLGGNNKGSIAGKNNKLNKKIICLETKKIYPSARIASQELKIDESCIRKVCKRERQSAGGFHWEDYDENKDYTITVPPLARGVGNTRKVKCIETEEIFSSCIEAANKIGSSSSLIGRCCRGTQKTTRELHFCYIGGE